MKKVFVCFPLNHEDQAVIETRILAAKKYCRDLLSQGITPLSPALFGLVIKIDGESILFDAWEEFCYSYLEMADEIHVLRLSGYALSKGVAAEIQRAKEIGKNIVYIDL